MTVIFDTYIPGTSLLHRLDPRVKLWALTLSLLWVFALPNLWQQALLLAIVHAVLLAAAVPLRAVGGLWRQMAMLILLILVLQPLFLPMGRPLISLGPLQWTLGGLSEALRIALRAVNIAFLMGCLLFTTPHPTLVRAFVKLGLPYTWGLTISLALRFLPAIQNLFHNVRDAQAARGWRLKGHLLQRFRDHIPVLVAVLIGTLRMSDQLTLALAARGLETMGQRTTWRDLHMTRRDWITLVGINLTGFLLAWWRYT